MPLALTRFEATPNPEALKAIFEPSSHPALPQPPATRWFPSESAATADPLARSVFQVPGVVSLLIGPGWLTIGRARGSNAPWTTIKRGVTAAIASLSDTELLAPQAGAGGADQ
jgi:hypothetical protein